MPSPEKIVTTKVGGDLLDQLDLYAERHDRTRSWIVREALAQWLGEEEQRYRLTRDAMQSVTDGRTVSHDEAEARIAAHRNARSSAKSS